MFIVGLSNLGLVRVLPCSQGTYFSTKDEQWDATFLSLTPSVSTLGLCVLGQMESLVHVCLQGLE